MKTLVIYYANQENKGLSYQHGWVKAFKKNNLFSCDYLNLANFFPIHKSKPNIFELKNILFRNYDCIIILHSAFSNACLVPFYIQKILRHKNAFKVYFIGNEYKHMPEKMNFTKYLKINLFITQSHVQEVIDLYQNYLESKVEYIVNAGIDEEDFFPKKNYKERNIMIGYRTYPEPEYFGHQERVRLYNFLKEYSLDKNFNFDLSIKESDRFEYIDWANFLNNCKCLASSNTGWDYFSLNDDLRNKVNHSKIIDFNSIYDKFFKDLKKGVEWRCLTGKVIEPAACKTALILVKGDYYEFKPDIHYISLNKDYSNIDVCLEKLNDEQFINTIIENSYELVKNKYLYTHLLDKLYNIIQKEI